MSQPQVQDLDEFGAENDALENEALNNPQLGEGENDNKSVNEDAVETGEVAEPDTEDTEEALAEAWTLADDQTSDAEGAEIPNSAWKAARESYKAKQGKKDAAHDEVVNNLNTRIAQLEQGGQRPQQQPQPMLGALKREQFDEYDDPDAAYTQALVSAQLVQDRQISIQNARYQQAQQQFEAQQRIINDGVDQHSKRAEDLATKSNINPDTYYAAELRVRGAVESVFPGQGDFMTDSLISNVGKGSERSIYNLGINPEKLDEFTNSLIGDRNGLKATAFLARLGAELQSAQPRKRTTKAPNPAKQVSGDQAVKPTGTTQKAMNAAQSSGDIQGAIDIKRKAKAAGVDVSTW